MTHDELVATLQNLGLHVESQVVSNKEDADLRYLCRYGTRYLTWEDEKDFMLKFWVLCPGKEENWLFFTKERWTNADLVEWFFG